MRTHADHMLGLDEVRIFNFRQERPMDAYGSESTLAGIRRTFWYAFEDTPPGGGKPQVTLHPLESAGEVAGLPVQPFPILHGLTRIQGPIVSKSRRRATRSCAA
jgi:phosphoribosyl 1,2-cyclic phosphate phosphodiesterase